MHVAHIIGKDLVQQGLQIPVQHPDGDQNQRDDAGLHHGAQWRIYHKGEHIVHRKEPIVVNSCSTTWQPVNGQAAQGHLAQQL